jgi:ribosomal protein S18 acetylase RimI-like enzyme
MPRLEVTRTYLRMTSPADLAPVRLEDERLRIERVHDCPPSFFRYLYVEVGRAYHWVDRLDWSDERLRARLAQAGVELYLLTHRGAPAGYYELERHPDHSIEIAYFGLLPEFLRRGFGKHLLTDAVERAWSLRPTNVWLHTCTLDDPAALPNYERRGFRAYRSEIYVADLVNKDQ